MFNASILRGQVRPSTLRLYVHDFAAYVAFAGDAEALNPQSFARWRAHLVGETDRSPRTINRKLTAVRAVFREAAAVGLVEQALLAEFLQVRDVKVRALKHRMRTNNRTAITPEQMRAFCEAPDVATLKGLRDRALFLTLATSGCRISEVLDLKRTDIRSGEAGYWFRVVGKTDVAPRVVPLSPEAIRAIDAWLSARRADASHVFTSFGGRGERVQVTPLSAVSAWRIVQGYAKQLGIDHIKPHDFRRFVATQLARKDIRQAQRVLGHANINYTMQYYVLDKVEIGITDDLF